MDLVPVLNSYNLQSVEKLHEISKIYPEKAMVTRILRVVVTF